jgi:hypothetical protein
MKQKSFSRKAVCGMGAIALAAGLIAGGAVGFALQPEPVVMTKIVSQEVQVEVPVEVPVNVTVEKIVEVENPDFPALCASLEDREVISDAEECLVEIQAEDEAIALAIKEIKDEGLDFLEDEGILEDEDDIEFVRIYGDYEDIEVLDSDYDDEEYSFLIEAKVKDDNLDEKVRVMFEVSVEDGEAELEAVELVV